MTRSHENETSTAAVEIKLSAGQVCLLQAALSDSIDKSIYPKATRIELPIFTKQVPLKLCMATTKSCLCLVLERSYKTIYFPRLRARRDVR